MSPLPLVHSLHHWYYPPLVQHIVADLETVARGYGERLDDFRPSKMLKRKLEKSENKANDEAGRRAKEARTSTALKVTQSSNLELRCLTDAGAAPVWFPKVPEVWTDAVGHVSHLDLASPTSTRRFALPPIHLFWGGNEKSQQLSYYHFLLLRLEIKHRHTRDVPALTTREWRSILNGTYWKLQWPKRDNPSQDATFDPSVFWKYGGPLFFGDERSVDVVAGRHSPTSALPCGCDVQMTSADDPDVRQVALYYLNSFHAIAEIKEMERLQFPAEFERRWRWQGSLVEQMVEMWDPSGGNNDFTFFHNKKVWRNWLWLVREVVMQWDGFDDWDWGYFSDVRRVRIKTLPEQDFYKLTIRLLSFFIHSFVSRLGYYPSPILNPPILATVSCVKHRRKFGSGYSNFIM
ncbi:hypothetical protein EDB89DRAFT_1972868 [Lactarius sanguifluus]|nr:hypothetical protein EDB89DRAFT_1972868 [Lactarius sanguifluus]